MVAIKVDIMNADDTNYPKGHIQGLLKMEPHILQTNGCSHINPTYRSLLQSVGADRESKKN